MGKGWRSSVTVSKRGVFFAGDSSFTDDYVKALKDFAKDNKDIVFVGFQSGKPLEDLFLNCLAVVHPSESEGLPIAVLEAMSYGKVVLASDIPENMELVKDFGMHFRNKDIDDLTEKLEIWSVKKIWFRKSLFRYSG
jgi:glycosyltransferase involved in cell wall biosynthesis